MIFFYRIARIDPSTLNIYSAAPLCEQQISDHTTGIPLSYDSSEAPKGLYVSAILFGAEFFFFKYN